MLTHWRLVLKEITEASKAAATDGVLWVTARLHLSRVL